MYHFICKFCKICTVFLVSEALEIGPLLKGNFTTLPIQLGPSFWITPSFATNLNPTLTLILLLVLFPILLHIILKTLLPT